MSKLLLAASVCLLASLTTQDATAFCGFYAGGADAQLFNDATQVTLMRDGNTTVLSMQNSYEGPMANFAMIVPVPQVLKKKNVKTLPKTAFDRIDTLTAPRLVEYWERDPCEPVLKRLYDGAGGAVDIPTATTKGAVRVQARFSVGEYDIVVLSAKEATALESWLKKNKYAIPKGAAPFFKPYIEGGSYFFVAKINAKRVKYKDGKAVLSPLRFHYSSDKFELPIRLGLINSKGEQDLIVYILADGTRYEVANYNNVMIPTNLEVNPQVAQQFGDFYESLFSRTIEENPKTVVTEYAWQASWCDPCPDGVSALQQEDFLTLGADVVTNGERRNWIVTRLHMRYGADGVGEDLVFKKAPATQGGVESPNMGKQGVNQFQGRYIIRHEWPGKLDCPSPIYGRWGGPWADAEMAQHTAAVSRNTLGSTPKKVELDTLLKSVKKPGAEAAPPEPPKMDEPPIEPTDKLPPAAPAKQTKAAGCQVTSLGSSPLWMLTLLALGLFWRRRG